MQLNGETKGFPVGWNMTSAYNGVLNNNASKTNRCPEKPYNSDKTFLTKTSKHNRYTQPPLKTTSNYMYDGKRRLRK